MALFHVQRYELYIQTVEVEADSVGEAIFKVNIGEGTDIDDGDDRSGLEYVETVEDRGFPADQLDEEDQELLGLCHDDIVPAIHSVTEVPDLT